MNDSLGYSYSNGHLHALDPSSCDLEYIHRSYRQPYRNRPIFLNKNFKNYLLGESYRASGTDCMKLSVNFTLAVTIVHELAHQAWYYLAGQRRYKNYDEPEVQSEGFTELGWSWEKSVFGDGCLNSKIDGKYGALGLHMVPRFRSNLDNVVIDCLSFEYPISCYWLLGFFLKRKWQEFDRLSGDQHSGMETTEF